MKKYLSPVFIMATGTISMTVSQLGQLGVGEDVIENWEGFWAENGDDILAAHSDFNVNDQSTWVNGFQLNDPDTWSNLFF